MKDLFNNYLQNICLLVLFILTFIYTDTKLYAGELTVAVANSTCKTIKKVGELYTQTHDIKIIYICKSSGRLAKGLQGGAISADIYLSANSSWMDYMFKHDLVLQHKVSSPWGNKLVIAANKDSDIKINELADLTTDKIKTIYIGDPGTAPFGRYAKEVFQKAKLWEKIKNKIATRKHITLLADTLAKSDNLTIGVLFLSNTSNQHRIVYAIDQSLHSAIRYYMAPLKKSINTEQATQFIRFLKSQISQQIFHSAGFVVNTH